MIQLPPAHYRLLPDLPQPAVMPFEFTGSGREYFRIWSVNLLLSVLTLGIYSAWAKVRRERWFLGNTLLDGSPFDYHGRPLAILKGRLLVVGLLVVVNVGAEFSVLVSLLLPFLFMAVLPWMVSRALAFRAFNTSWRGLRFHFSGGSGEAAMAYLLMPMLGAATLGWIWPLVVIRQREYLFNALRFGQCDFRLRMKPGPIYQVFTMLWFGTLAGLVVAGIASALLYGALKWLLNGWGAGMAMAVLPFVMMAGLLALVPLWRARIACLTFAALQLGPHGFACDQTAAGLLRVMARNLLLTVLTLGFYYPFAMVNLWRYRVEHLSFVPGEDLDHFVAQEQAAVRVTGEEAADLLDVDLGL